MKYFAVTDDPNELMHYGIKGMKWGVIRTDAQLGHPNKPSMKKPKLNSLLTKPLSDRDRQAIIAGTYVKINNAKSSRSSVPHSPAYISASSKLRKIMKSGIDKAKASWDNYNSPKVRSERMFQKHVQLARQGRLKYKGISDKEVERITDRLALERQARNLSGAEKPSFVRRAISSMGEGVISGLGQGMANRVSERMTRGSKLKTQRMMNEQTAEFNRKQARENFKRSQREQRERDKYADERADKQEREKLNKEYARIMDEEGHPIASRNPFLTQHAKRKRLYDVNERRDRDAYSIEIQKAYDRQRANQQAIADNARYLETARSVNDAIKSYDPTTTRRLTPGGTGALARLNAYNEAHEKYNSQLNDIYNDERAYARSHGRYKTPAINRREREQESIARTEAAKYRAQLREEQQKAQAAREAETRRLSNDRARIDSMNTSTKRKKKSKRTR